MRRRQVEDDVLEDLLGRLEAERGRVADVELEDAVALGLHPLGLLQHRAADVVADVGELRRLGHLHARNHRVASRRSVICASRPPGWVSQVPPVIVRGSPRLSGPHAGRRRVAIGCADGAACHTA